MKIRLVANGNLDREARLVVRPQLEDLGREILEDAKRAAPVDTGHLRDSGSFEVDEEGLTVGFEAEYAEFVSDGTSSMRGNPFFRQAIYKRRITRRPR